MFLELQPEEEEEEPLGAGGGEHQDNNPTGEEEEGQEAELLRALAEGKERNEVLIAEAKILTEEVKRGRARLKEL